MGSNGPKHIGTIVVLVQQGIPHVLAHHGPVVNYLPLTVQHRHHGICIHCIVANTRFTANIGNFDTIRLLLHHSD